MQFIIAIIVIVSLPITTYAALADALPWADSRVFWPLYMLVVSITLVPVVAILIKKCIQFFLGKELNTSSIRLSLITSLILWYIFILSIPVMNYYLFIRQFGTDDYFWIWTPMNENSLFVFIFTFLILSTLTIFSSLLKYWTIKRIAVYLLTFWIFSVITLLFSQQHIYFAYGYNRFKSFKILNGINPKTFVEPTESWGSNYIISDDTLYSCNYYYSTYEAKCSPFEGIIDSGTFEMDQSWGFALDINNAYCIFPSPSFSIFPIKGVDIKSFEAIELSFAKDKDNIYYNSGYKCITLSGVDRETWTYISKNCSKDKNSVYYCYLDTCITLDWVDAETFWLDWAIAGTYWYPDTYKDKFWKYILEGSVDEIIKKYGVKSVNK